MTPITGVAEAVLYVQNLVVARPLRRLLCVDYLHESQDKTEAFAFVDVAEMDGRFSPRLSRRVRQSLAALAGGNMAYLED